MKIFRQELDGSQGNFKKIIEFSQLKLDNLKSNKKKYRNIIKFFKNSKLN